MTTRIRVADHKGLVGSAQKRRLERDRNNPTNTASLKNLLRRIHLRKPGYGMRSHSPGVAERRDQTVIPGLARKSCMTAKILVAICLFLFQSAALAAMSSDQSNTVSSTSTTSLKRMNAGLNDAWFNSETSGQGFFVTVFPEIGYVSLSWFTYDTERPADHVTANLGEPGHRWLNALGQIFR